MSDYVDSLCELRLPVLSVDSILLFTCRETGITTYTSLLNSKAILEIRLITQLDVEWETVNISEKETHKVRVIFWCLPLLLEF